MTPEAIVTIVSNNYLHYARTLMESVARHHPEAARYCVIVDRDMQPGLDLAAEFEAIPLSALGLPFGDEFTFQYTILELNTAVKPWALAHLFERGHGKVLYIDPDIYLYQPLTEVLDLLAGGASIVLTPHLLAPAGDELHPNDLAIRVAGTYNLGFCALADHPAAHAFLRWWQGKLARHCVVDNTRGIFVDQSWVDLVPGMFDDVAILRHPGYNVAYWNLAQRTITRSGDAVLVNGLPLRFFHFSGIDPKNPQPISKHQDRHTLVTVGPLARTLFIDYCDRVMARQMTRYASLPYGYANFSNGTPIAPYVRSHFRSNAEMRAKAAEKPFEHPDLAEDALGPARLSALYMYFLKRPVDPVALGNGADACASWHGYLRIAFGVGRSAESRRHPGWQLRLLLWPMLGRRRLARAGVPATQPAASLPVAPAAPRVAAVAARAQLAAAGSAAPGINLVGYLAAELGVGEAARSLARACSAAGVPYSVVDVGYQTDNLQRDTQMMDGASTERFAIDMVYVNADQTATTVAYLQSKKLDSAYKIGFWHWEQPSLPQSHLAAFSLLDEVWVPSNFVRDAVAAVSPVPVFVVPHALQCAATQGVQRSAFGLPDDKLLALVMYDFHSYQQRKNPQAAIAAFRLAAAGRSDAVLVIKTINGEHHPEQRAALAGALADLPGTVMIDQFLTRQQVWDLQACCDLLISLHRAEGFGLAPAEMMYLGKPVVATGWSANMDFMTHENSMPVRFTLAPLAAAVGAYPAGPLWAEADVQHAAECIARLLDEPLLRASMGQRAALEVRRQLDPATVGRRVAGRLAAIIHWHPRLAQPLSVDIKKA